MEEPKEPLDEPKEKEPKEEEVKEKKTAREDTEDLLDVENNPDQKPKAQKQGEFKKEEIQEEVKGDPVIFGDEKNQKLEEFKKETTNMDETKKLALRLETLFTFSLLVYSSFAIGTTLLLMAVFMAVTFYLKKKEEGDTKAPLESCNKTSEEIA